MIFKRFYEDKLAQASFLVGCPAAGEAIVIDANRDVDTYLRAAEAEGVRITGVTETHIHADFVSGSRDLAGRTGARLYLSDEGGEDWKYAFAHEPNVTRLRAGDRLSAGSVRLQALHTPGHTPEHLCFTLTDTAATDQPMGVFSGDFIFAGDVGRPDLLERAAGQAGAAEQGARALFRSLQEFKRLPGHLMLWPSHGSGSACGKHLGGVPVTTLAYEQVVNEALRATDEDAFVAAVLAGQPDPPRYFGEMKRINREGPARIDAFRSPPRLDPEGALTTVESGALVVDLRRASEFARSFVPGVLHLPPGASFSKYAGTVLPYDRPVYLLAGAESEVAGATRDLAMIGIDDVRGWANPSTVMIGWNHRHGEPERLVRVAFEDVLRRVADGTALLLDVRDRGEYAAGHVPGAVSAPLGELAARAAELPIDRPIAVHCQGGERSVIAVSLLRRAGFTHLADVEGGFTAYAAAGGVVETGEPSGAVAG